MTGVNPGIPLFVPKNPEIGKKKNPFFPHNATLIKNVKIHSLFTTACQCYEFTKTQILFPMLQPNHILNSPSTVILKMCDAHESNSGVFKTLLC